jgi:hypothetical protein
MIAHFLCDKLDSEFATEIDGYLYVKEDDELYVWDKYYYIIIMRNGAPNTYYLWNDKQERFKELFEYCLPNITKIHIYTGSRIIEEYVRELPPSVP